MKKNVHNILYKKIFSGCLLASAFIFCTGCGKEAVETTEGVSTDTTQEEAVAEDTAAETQSDSENKEGADYYVKVNADNQWDVGEGNIGAQCDLIFYNNTDGAVSDWTLTIQVPDGFQVDSLWNGTYEIKDGVLTITSVDYNKTIEAKNNIPIGFIMRGSSVITESDITLTVGGQTYANNAGGGAATEEDGKQADSETDKTTEAATENEVAKKPDGETALASYGKLSVKGTNLVDHTGKTVQLTGVSTHGLSWFPEYVNKDAFQSLRDGFGVNLIRLAMYTDENGGYCTDGDKDKLEKLIDQAVKDTKELGMYVIIDWHVLHDLNPKKYQQEAEKFFDKMSAKYADYDNVIYEICNEPNGGTSWSDVKAYAEDIIPVIRKNAKDSVIIVGTPTWCQDVDVAAKDPITKYDNLLYAVHFYAATHKDDIRNKTKQAIEAGLPIIISEFSICDASGNGGIDYDSAAAWMELADKYHLSFAGWSLSNKAETASLLSPDCKKTSGFTESDLSETGKWLMSEIKKR